MDSGAYYFIAADGRRGDVIRVETWQPEITNPEDYLTYLWAKCIQGTFLLRQQFLEGRPQQWHLLGEILPEEDEDLHIDEVGEFVKLQISEGEV